jgi:hypothetical protein
LRRHQSPRRTAPAVVHASRQCLRDRPQCEMNSLREVARRSHESSVCNPVVNAVAEPDTSSSPRVFAGDWHADPNIGEGQLNTRRPRRFPRRARRRRRSSVHTVLGHHLRGFTRLT